MAAVVFPIMVKMDPANASAGARRVEGDLEKIKQKALDVNRTIRQVFGVFAIRELSGGLYDLVDTYTALQNKLRVVAKDQANLNGLTEATFKIAQDTRSSWEATATMYQRMALNSRQLGVSQKDLLGFTKSLNQAVIVGGATSQEAAAGLLQLSQGMASGALRGDELRAVLEELPVVADVIAKKFGVTRGALRALGTQGKITGKDIIDAFKQSAPELEELYAKTIPTLSQSFEMLRNSAIKFFGEAGAGSGVTQSLAQAIKFLSDHAEVLGKVLLAVGQAFLGLMAIKTVISLVSALFTIIATNPLTSFIMLLASGILLLRQFGDNINTSTKAFGDFGTVAVTIGDYLRAIWDYFKALGGEITEFLSGAWASLTDAFSNGLDSSGIELSFENVLKFAGAFVFTMISIFRHMKDMLMLIFGGIPTAFAEMFDNAFHGVVKSIEWTINKLIDAVQVVIKAYNFVHGALSGDDARADELDSKIMKLTSRQVQNLGGLTDVGVMTKMTMPGGDQVDVQKDPATLHSQSVHIGAVLEENKKLQRQIDELQSQRNAIGGDIGDLSHIEMDRSGVQGAGAILAKGLEDTRNEIIQEVVDDLDNWDKNAKANALAREKAKLAVNSTVDTDPSKYQAPGQGKTKDTWSPLLRQLDMLEKRSNDVREAELKMNAAQELIGKTGIDKNGHIHSVLEELAKRGLTAGTVLDDLRESLKGALDPLGAWLDKQIEMATAMTGTNEQYEHNKAVLTTINELTEKGLTLTEAQKNEISRVTQAVEDRAKAWEHEKKITESLKDPMHDYLADLATITLLYNEGKIYAYQYEGAVAAIGLAIEQQKKSARDLKLEYMALSDEVNDKFVAGFLMGINDIRDSMLSLAVTVKTSMMEAFQDMENFIIDAAETGDAKWEDLGKNMIHVLNKVALKLLETWLLTKAIGLASGDAGAVAGAISSGGDGSDLGYGGGYASGGSYTVPGTGAPDSRLVAFHLTPGERVDFTPPNYVPGPSAPASAGASYAPGGQTKVSIHNHIDRGELLSAVDTPDGDRVIINSIRKNAGAIKTLLQK